jgi:opacity protein-like surface antigen
MKSDNPGIKGRSGVKISVKVSCPDLEGVAALGQAGIGFGRGTGRKTLGIQVTFKSAGASSAVKLKCGFSAMAGV